MESMGGSLQTIPVQATVMMFGRPFRSWLVIMTTGRGDNMAPAASDTFSVSAARGETSRVSSRSSLTNLLRLNFSDGEIAGDTLLIGLSLFFQIACPGKRRSGFLERLAPAIFGFFGPARGDVFAGRGAFAGEVPGPARFWLDPDRFALSGYLFSVKVSFFRFHLGSYSIL